jgi:hypothetical protein
MATVMAQVLATCYPMLSRLSQLKMSLFLESLPSHQQLEHVFDFVNGKQLVVVLGQNGICIQIRKPMSISSETQNVRPNSAAAA